VFWIVITEGHRRQLCPDRLGLAGSARRCSALRALLCGDLAAAGGDYGLCAVRDRRALMVWRRLRVWGKWVPDRCRIASVIKLPFDGGDPGSIRFAADSAVGRRAGYWRARGFECP